MKTKLLFLSFILPLTFSCSSHKTKTSDLSASVSLREDWFSDNAKTIEAFLNQDKISKAVAIFDWDNTIIKNDIGDATIYWMLKHDLLKRPKSWRSTSRHLSSDALKALNKYCPLKNNDYLKTNEDEDCAETILEIYSDGKLKNGKEAWRKSFNPNLLEPAYAWAVHLAQGHRPNDLKKIAADVIDFNLNNSIGEKQKVGHREVEAYIRVYPQMKELIAKLKERGADVWVVSASMQYYVEEFAQHVGIVKNRVIGIRPTLDHKGMVTTKLQGCSRYRSANQDIITFRQGKRCWINKEIFKMKDSKNNNEQLNTPSPTQFAAGDSDTDFFFVKDASDLRVVINRQKNEIMCHALNNSDGHWLINPMFIKPKGKKSSLYSCQKFALKDQEDRNY